MAKGFFEDVSQKTVTHLFNGIWGFIAIIAVILALAVLGVGVDFALEVIVRAATAVIDLAAKVKALI